MNSHDLYKEVKKQLNPFLQRFLPLIPHRHMFAVFGLVILLSILVIAPKSNDAQASNRTIIILTESTERRIANQPVVIQDRAESPSSPVEIESTTSPALQDLNSILSLTEFKLAHEHESDNALTADEIITTVIEEDNRLFLEVGSGDNLSLLFYRAGLSDQDVYRVSRSGEYSNILTNLFPGYQLAFEVDDDNNLFSLEVIRSPLISYLYSRTGNDSYESSIVEKEPSVKQQFNQATISDSLFLAAQRGGISAAHTMEFAGIFGGVIDFMLDPREGDTFNVLYEEKYLNDEFIGNGNILAAQFTNQGTTYTALRYTNSAGETDYYNPEGESMRKAFLRNPVDFVRISSSFNPNRRHPILNTIRAHRGTDYAAPRGTPVVATADGRVTWAARNGSFGKLVVVQHNGRFETKYAHLNDYARGVSVGSRVRQGQVIGYVGSTGGATGPHLHYEFLMDGVHRNSRTIHDQLPKAESIAETEVSRFNQQTQSILSTLASRTQPAALAQNTHSDPQ